MHMELEDFLEAHRSKLNEQSQDRYRRDLEIFADWLNQEDLHPHEVSRRDLKRYISYMQEEKGYAPKSRRTIFATVRVFYNEEYEDGLIDENPADSIKSSDAGEDKTMIEEHHEDERVFLSEDEIQQLVENAPRPVLRNRTLILFQYQTGLRRHEVAKVLLEKLDREKRKVTVIGKHDKKITAYWQPSLDGLLDTWIDTYRKKSPYAADSPYLFLSASAGKLAKERVNQVVRAAAENGGLQEVLYTQADGRPRYLVTSHVLRHSFAAHWIKRGGSTEGLQQRFAHTESRTTETYKHALESWVEDESKAVGVGSDIEVSTDIEPGD